METGTILILLAVFVPVVLFVSRPFWQGKPSAVVPARAPGLAAEYERALDAIRELEFDYRLGKILEEDYASRRAALVQKAAGLLRRMDEGSLPPSPADDPLEAMIAARRKLSDNVCPSCGTPVSKTDRFCSKCGAKIG